jgi:hypothetical protein
VSSALRIAKQARRAQLEAELGARILALPTEQYGAAIADPGLRFEPYNRTTGMDRAADNHYATSPLETIKAVDVRSFMAKDSAVFLWATAPMLPQALEVMAAWGFIHKSTVLHDDNGVRLPKVPPGVLSSGSRRLGEAWRRNAT